MKHQQSLWLDSCHPPKRMSEQIASLGKAHLPKAKAALASQHSHGEDSDG